MAQLPTGTVTFLFTDIEGSTWLLQRLGPTYAQALGEHQAFLRAAWIAHGGAEIDTTGDGFFVAFPSAPEAVAAAAEATRALAAHQWPDSTRLCVRMGLHTGTPQLVGDHYVGLDVHRAARIAAAGHGGQMVLSQTTRDLAEYALPAGATLRDLGSHRLKDLQHAEHLYQLMLPDLPGEFPPLRTLDAHPHNLPIQPTPLLGREEPVAAVCTLLRREDVRLVTLTGAGGIGKTRLSIQIAAELVEDFPDGVWFVRLSRLVDPDLVLPSVAQTLGLKEQGSQPIAELLREYLRTKRVLLVLDNFEQVVGAAAEVATLQESAPQLKALVTSRIRLHLRGEQEYPLGPLPLPNLSHLPAPEGLTQYAAVALFIERAKGARPDFAVTAANAPAIAAICARLDGLPLAIELAAAWVKLLPPEALLSRLSAQLTLLTGGARDADERQQTMRNTLAWSYDLLAPEVQGLFRRLAVFVGGCTLEAAEAVCAAPAGAVPLGVGVLEGLGTLVDQSLVQQREEGGEPRFGMLHVIREYGLEQLEASGEAQALRLSHLTYLVAFIEPVNFRELRGLQGTYWLARLDREQDNVRAALSWAATGGEAQLGLRLAVGVAGYWWERGYYREAAGWLDHLLAARPKDQDVDATVVWAVGCAGVSAANLGDLDQAVTLMEQALAGARTIGDASAVAAGLQLLGSYAVAQGDTERGLALLDECLVEARHLDDDVDIMLNTIVQAADCLLRVPGEERRAVALATETVEVAQRVGKPLYESPAHTVLAFAALQRGDLAQAEEHALRALRVACDQGLTSYVHNSVERVALVAGRKGQALKSARLLGAVTAREQAMGTVNYPDWQAAIETMVAPARAMLGEEQWAAAFAAGRALTLEEAVAEALEETSPG